MTKMAIGRLAESAGVTESTVRYYEREGVLPCARRTDSGYRWYDDRDLERLQLVLRAKALGFTLTEIRELFGSTGHRAPADVLSAARRRRELVETELERLGLVLRRLDQLVAVCDLGDPSQCQDLDIPEPLDDDRASKAAS
jgi:MerR family transcriptional regulator, copper efflux regulator